MAAENLKKLNEAHTPWCTLILVFGALLCHALVLVGNYKTAEAMNALGDSTAGWSHVGIGLARSLRSELDATMVDVSEELIDSLSEIAIVSKVIDFVLTVVGFVADKAMPPEPVETMLLQAHAAPGNVSMLLLRAAPSLSLLQGPPQKEPSALAPLVNEAIERVVQTGMDLIKKQVDKLMLKMKPVLEKIGVWIEKFGHKIQDAIESFSGSLDKVQKIFDQIMAQLNGQGDNEDLMIQQTFGLFDVSGAGYVSVEDLLTVSQLYSISALAGDKSQILVAKYDADGDGQLTRDEFQNLVGDSSVPNILAVVLRTYARRLAEVGGQMASARMRDEVALELVHYLGLVCAKNMTKVGWISDRLSNASLPTEFSASVMVQMCLTADDPQALSGKDIGATVVGTMYEYNAAHTVKCANLISDTDWFVSEGFNPLDQPGCVKMVTEWVASAKAKESASLLSVDDADESKARRAAIDAKVYEAMPMVAYKLAQENLQQYTTNRREQFALQRASLYSTSTSQLLLDRLFGGTAASTGAGIGGSPGVTPAERAIAAGQPAVPATLEFAQWLCNNASKNAEIFVGYSFEYSSESSTPVDTFSTQLQSMIKQIQSFIKMMMKYVTPAGIKKIEDMVEGLTGPLGDYVTQVVLSKTQPMVDKIVPAAELGIKQVAYDAGENIGYQLSEKLVEPLKDAVEKGIEKVTDKLHAPKTQSEEYAEMLGDVVGKKLANLTAPVLADKLGNMLVDLVDEGLDKAAEKMEAALDENGDKSSLVMKDKKAVLSTGGMSNKMEDELFLGDGGKLEDFVVLLRALTNLIPTATETLKFARTQVSKAAKNMDTIFTKFEDKGPEIFDGLAYHWRVLWTVYFCLLAPFTILFLYYGCWASGYCGGPQPIDSTYEPPTTFTERLRCVGGRCCTCFQSSHDTDLCMWSCLILLQVLVLLIFVVSILLCILAGVKSFITSGCAQVYILGDDKACASTLKALSSWLSNFHVEKLGEMFQPVCARQALVTCSLISDKMATSAMCTTVFSLLGTIMSLQMIIETAVQHEQAVFRRKIRKILEEEK